MINLPSQPLSKENKDAVSRVFQAFLQTLLRLKLDTCDRIQYASMQSFCYC